MKVRSSLLFAVVFFAPAYLAAPVVNRPAQEAGRRTAADALNLKFGGELLVSDGEDPRPLALSSGRLLIPAGDTLYALGEGNRVIWEYGFGGNNITDVTLGPEGKIYASVLDGLLIALDDSGKKVWSNFLNGSGNYVQVKSYGGDGLLAVIDMSAYRGRLDTDDRLQLWKNGAFVWTKEFPRGAELHVWGDTILALTRTREGKVVKVIR